MAGKDTLLTQKRRGPAPTGKGELVGVRLQPDMLKRLDSWISVQGPNPPSRPEAIRRLLDNSLAR